MPEGSIPLSVNETDQLVLPTVMPPRRFEPGSTTVRDYATHLTAAATTGLLVAAIWLSNQVQPSPMWHDIALFAHLASLMLGFGAVLVADYFFVLWRLGRVTFAEAVRSTSRLHLLVWAGLTVLVASGTLLQPNLQSPVTLVKLGLVLGLSLNGVHIAVVGQRMAAINGTPPVRLLIRGGLATVVSQICWWGAIVIGFVNANS